MRGGRISSVSSPGNEVNKLTEGLGSMQKLHKRKKGRGSPHASTGRTTWTFGGAAWKQKKLKEGKNRVNSSGEEKKLSFMAVKKETDAQSRQRGRRAPRTPTEHVPRAPERKRGTGGSQNPHKEKKRVGFRQTNTWAGVKQKHRMPRV